MSSESKWICRIARILGFSKPESPRKFYAKLRKNAIRYKKGEKIPKKVSGTRVEKGVYCGMLYYTFIPRSVECAASVVYLHGSGYVNAHKRVQEKFAALLAKETHAKVYFPIYPKLPICTAAASTAILNNFLVFLLKKGKIVLAGDSSGGALCLILAQGLQACEKIIAISPWVDLNLDLESEKLKERDVFLSPERLRRVAKLWAYDLPFESPCISPLYGCYEGKEILLFCGDSEIFLPSVRSFFESNRKKKVRIEYIEGKDQPHDYPLFPTPEGKEAREIILKTLIRFLYERR